MLSLKNWSQPKLISVLMGSSTDAFGSACKNFDGFGPLGDMCLDESQANMCLDAFLS